MDSVRTTGTLLTLASLVGYVAGIAGQYPGRELSVAGVMAGVTLMAVGGP